jgi:Cu-processing system permease protein
VRTLFVIAGVTLREASRRRLLLAGILLGIAFVLVYATGLWFVIGNAPCGGRGRPCRTAFELLQIRTALNMISLAGLYVANLLVVATAVLLPVDTISGEIASGITQTLASKPIRRAEILLGKWLAYFLVVGAYLCLTAGGVLLSVWAISRVPGQGGFVVPGAARGLVLMLLAATIMLTLSIGGGTRFSTVTNGMVCFGVFGLGYLGGWIEQIGEIAATSQAGRVVARNIGVVVSLLSPSDAVWRLAASGMMPPLARTLGITPFAPMSPPNLVMAAWALGYVAVLLALALRSFERRSL